MRYKESTGNSGDHKRDYTEYYGTAYAEIYLQYRKLDK